MTIRKYKLQTEFIQLIQLLKTLGISETGGQAKLMVEDGLVKLNGEIEFRKRAKLKRGDRIEILNQLIEIE